MKVGMIRPQMFCNDNGHTLYLATDNRKTDRAKLKRVVNIAKGTDWPKPNSESGQ